MKINVDPNLHISKDGNKFGLKMGLDMRKPVFGVFEQQRRTSAQTDQHRPASTSVQTDQRRPACTSAQTDQHTYYSLFRKYHI